MKTLAHILTFCMLTAAVALADSPFKIDTIKPVEVSPGVVEVKLKTTLLEPLPFTKTVPVPTAPIVLNGQLQIKNALMEESLLGSFLHEDMNGDGHLNQVLVGPWEKGLRIDGVKIETMGKGESRQEPYRENGKMKRYILDPDGPEFSVLYFLDPMIGMLIGHRTERPEVLELANPNLQLVVFEHSTPVKGPTFLPEEPHFKMTVDGKEPEEKHLLFAWEPGLFQKLKLSPRWLRAWWVTIPLETKPGTSEHTLQVEAGLASPNLGLFAQINYSTEEGVQMRTDRSVGLLWSRKKKD